MPNKRTFSIKPIAELIREEIPEGELVIDPFPFEYKEDATDYLSKLSDNSCMYILFDPPYSPRQLKECYKGLGEYDTKASTWSRWKNLIGMKTVVGGKVLSFGWNTNGIGINRGFRLDRILLVAHGGNHNDTICVVETKIL